MKEYKPSPGEDIRTTALTMCDMTGFNISVTAKFNGIELIAVEETTPKSIVSLYQKRMRESDEIYRKSPEGIKAKKDREIKIKEMQNKTDILLIALKSLDFSCYEDVINWLCAYQECSDHTGVNSSPEYVLDIFRDNGFVRNENTGSDYIEGDYVNVARYIIGQALGGLGFCSIHPIIHKFAEDWRKLDNKKPA